VLHWISAEVCAFCVVSSDIAEWKTLRSRESGSLRAGAARLWSRNAAAYLVEMRPSRKDLDLLSFEQQLILVLSDVMIRHAVERFGLYNWVSASSFPLLGADT
jgi:hypothetical protein